MPATLPPAVHREALHLTALGYSPLKIEEAMHGQISDSTVHRLKQKAENKAIIEREQAKILAKLSNPVDRLLGDMELVDKLGRYFAGQEVPDIRNVLDRLGFTKVRTMQSDTGQSRIEETDMTTVLKFYDSVTKRTDKVLAAVGLLPSPTHSSFTAIMLNDNRQSNQVHPAVVGALGNYLADQLEQLETIEGEPQDMGSPSDCIVVEPITNDMK